jgi:hypothetical protein
MKRRFPNIVMTGALLVTLAGCGGSSEEDQSRVISRADLGSKWPLTVESGTLRCGGSGGVGAVTFATGSATYAVNGTAKDDPGLKLDMGALTDEGLKLCR